VAEDRSVGGLYLRLGLSLSELETGFVTAERTVAANISRLNRESNLIRIRSEIEIAGLDETADAERILQIRTEALNRQMAIQRDRVRILTAELQSLTAAHGENSTVAQRAAVRLERERLTLANLERDLRSLNDAQGESNNSFGELNDMLPAMPTKLQAVGIAFGAVTAGIGAAATATKELVEEFRELQNQSYELNMSFPDTREFLREMRLAGGDIGDYEGFIRGITDAYVKGEYDDPEFIALRKYGAEIVDATGRLKDFKDISEEVFQAWEKADAAGEGIEFLQLAGGESGIRDAIQYFQRLREAREDAAKIFKAEIDDEQLHKLDRSLNLVEEQSKELKAALGDIFVPAVQSAAENFFNVLHDGTAFLAENKDEIQKWGFVASEVLGTIASKVGGATDWLAETAKTPKGTTGNARVDKTMSAMGWRYQDFNQQKIFGINTDWDKFNAQIKESYGIFEDEVKRAEEKQKAFNGELKNATTVAGKMAQGISALSSTQKKHGDVLSQYGIQRVKEFKDELEDLKIELEFGDDEYQKALAQLDLWRKRELTDKLQVSDEESKAITELYAAKLQQIEKEHRDKIAEAIQSNWENAADIEYEMTHSAFEKQIRDIELWEEAQRKKAETAEEVQAIIAESAMKEAQAFEDEMDRIKGTLQSLEDKIFEQEHSQYENDLRRAQQERLKLYEDFQSKGILNADTQAMIERYFQNAVGKLNRRADESRKSGGDYTKTPEGARQFGGNGILVIESDKIVDDGLMKAQSQAIGLLTDENLIRQQLLPKLDTEAREAVERIQATKSLTAAQQDLLQSTRQAADGFQLIEGDKFAQPTAGDYQVITGDQVFTMPAEELQQFSEAVQQTTAPLQPLTESAQDAADAQKSFAEGVKDFPPEYFKNLADSAKGVSETQMLLTDSTLGLIDAQKNLADALKNLPSTNQGQNISNNQPLPTDGFMQLSNSTKEVRKEQDLLASSARDANASLREISDIPPQKQSDSGLKIGFDYDTFKDIVLTGVGIGAGAATTGVGAMSIPALTVGTLAVAGLGGLAKGTYDETNAAREQFATANEVDLSTLETALKSIDGKIQGVQQAMQDKVAIDFSELTTPLNAIDENTQRILQAMQDEQPHESDQLQELFGTLPNIEEDVKNILLALQSREEESELPESLSSLPRIDENVQSILQTLQSSKENPAAPITTTGGETVDYLTPLMRIDGNLQSVLQELQTPKTESTLADYMTPLNSIEGKVQSILQKVEAQQPVTFETIITPLDRIAGLVQNILAALGNRQPPQITIAPNNSIDLGGAYVFDNEMKQSLVNDITKDIVDEITTSVRQAISQTSYGYSA